MGSSSRAAVSTSLTGPRFRSKSEITSPSRFVVTVWMGKALMTEFECSNTCAKIGSQSLKLTIKYSSSTSSPFPNLHLRSHLQRRKWKLYDCHAFQILPVIFFFSFVIQILFYYGAMQWVVVKIGWLLQVTVGTTAAESMNAAANIFVGQVRRASRVRAQMWLLIYFCEEMNTQKILIFSAILEVILICADFI